MTYFQRVEGASENFRAFCTDAACDVIFSNSRGGGATAPGCHPLRAPMDYTQHKCSYCMSCAITAQPAPFIDPASTNLFATFLMLDNDIRTVTQVITYGIG